MLGCIGVVGIFYVIVMYALQSAFGFDNAAFLPAFPQLQVATSTPGLGSSGFGHFVEWIIILDIFAVALGVTTACVRGWFAMARDRKLPSRLAALHPTFKTPWISAIVLGAICLIVAVWAELADGIVAPALDPDGNVADFGSWFRIFQYGATFGALGLILVYLAIALSGFKQHAGEDRTKLLVAAVLGTGATGAAIFGTVYKAPPIWGLNHVWWTMLIWIAIGIALTVARRSSADTSTASAA